MVTYIPGGLLPTYLPNGGLYTQWGLTYLLNGGLAYLMEGAYLLNEGLATCIMGAHIPNLCGLNYLSTK